MLHDDDNANTDIRVIPSKFHVRDLVPGKASDFALHVIAIPPTRFSPYAGEPATVCFRDVSFRRQTRFK